MNRKDLDTIARGFRKSRPPVGPVGSYWGLAVECIAKEIEKENANFDREKFLARCGYE